MESHAETIAIVMVPDSAVFPVLPASVAAALVSVPVSYTHLDVYKRQDPRTDVLYCLLSQAGSSLMACEKQMSATQTLVFPCAHFFILRSTH